MSSFGRVLWSEGMLLRTQHLQQQDRWAEGLVRSATLGLRHHGWGFRTLQVEQGLLAQGRLALRRASGVMPDGTPFSFPDGGSCPEPLEIAAGAAQPVVAHLALPVQLAGAPEMDPPGREPSGLRYAAREVEIRDSVAQADAATAPLHVAELRFRLLDGTGAPRDAYVTLPVARVAAVMADGTLVLDEDFPVPCLGFGTSPYLAGVVEELVGKLESIARERAAFVTGRRAHGAGDLADFMALQLCNRYLAGARHLAAQRAAHPEDLYRWMLELLGEASSFAVQDPVAPAVEPYHHAEPWLSFRPLVAALRRVLLDLARPDRRAIQVPLRLFWSGARAAEVQDRSLFAKAHFYVAVQAPAAPEVIRQRLPGQITVGPAEDLQSMVRSAVPGIALRHVPTIPREIPVRRQMVYFELDRTSELWGRLQNSAGLAIHVTGELREGMEMECWAVRG
ncbi:type VI secretion system baseplate subunit TssK [Belnapia sp. T6]|uniref:Type VI secretion system baseplate subunit TssK n=1 Tax=Belnapia mucosa TaxID=2804532 RepID=A0ABS1VAG3_9PROT|nr:type VI secretion system baseplate subunit TssK [Belnapia mucosa]MBL6458657.1 type VI secretion system baseplate subunit TssK [Belnapia mucosa]